ncbi:MAG: serine/threonine-protein phosphatase [Pirellulales bacterium]|nr:serine/threonine-protein phosphatase [Pirellulales bacterium]
MDEAVGLEAKTFAGQDMTRASQHAVAGGVAMVFSARSPAKETDNEDAAAVVPLDADSAVLIVADGLGGGPSGEHASRLAVKNLRKAIQTAQGDEESLLRTAILDGLEEANRAILALGVGAATTVAIVEVSRHVVRPYHVGDSMILVAGQRGKIKLQTTSHSPVGFAVEAGVLDEKEAMFHEQRHLVSNVLGLEQMKIEIGPHLRLARYDTVLLASDGLCDNLHQKEIIQRIRKGPLPQAADRLAADATARMTSPADGQPSKPDDLTFVLYRRTS